MKRLEPKNFTLVLIISLVVLTVGGAIGFYFATKFMLAQKEALRQKKTDLYLSEQRIQQLTELKGKYSKASAKLDDITTALPNQKDQAEVIVQLKSEAEKIGFELTSVQFNDSGSSITKDKKSSDPNLTQTTKSGNVYVLPVSLKLRGTFSQLTTYLTTIEHLSRYNSVVSINIVQTGDKNGNSNVRDMTLLLNTYIKP